MEQSDIITLLIAIIGTLGGTSAWQYYQKKLEHKKELKEKEHEEKYVYRDDLRERVAILESKLEDSQKDKDILNDKLRSILEETAALRVEVQYLREERKKLQLTVDKLTEKLIKINLG
jgi:chromosome segregation ATPase